MSYKQKGSSLLENNNHSQLLFFQVEIIFAVINAFALYDTLENLQSLACGYRRNRHNTCNRHNMRCFVRFVRRRNKVAYCTRKKAQKIAVRNDVCRD